MEILILVSVVIVIILVSRRLIKKEKISKSNNDKSGWIKEESDQDNTKDSDGETYTVDVERIVPHYEKTIISLVRQRYSIDDEMAIQRQKETKPEQWQEYFDFVENCKMQAK